VTWRGRLFQTRAAATGNARSPTVDQGRSYRSGRSGSCRTSVRARTLIFHNSIWLDPSVKPRTKQSARCRWALKTYLGYLFQPLQVFLGRPVIDLTLHSSDKAITPAEVFKVRFYELCDCLKNFYHIYTDGSKIGHRVSAALCHKRGTSAIRLPDATSIFNAELHAILHWMLSKDLKKNTFFCCHIPILVSSRWEVVSLTMIRFINILKDIQFSQTVVKQLYSAVPVSRGDPWKRESWYVASYISS